MPTNIENYRRPITNGANALALQLEVSKPQLRLVKEPFIEPTQIQDFLKRTRARVNTQEAPDAVARQEVLQGNPEVERFIESELDEKKPWSAFAQVILTKEHKNPQTNEITKIWVGFSVALAGGVGEVMSQEMLRDAAGLQDSDFESWDGAVEGKIVAAHKPVSNVIQELDVIDRLIDSSERVIRTNHANIDHKVVQHYLNLQLARKDAAKMVKEDASEMLNDPDFKGRSAYQDKYNETGVYVIGGVIKGGIWYGPDVEGGLVPIEDVVTDKPHLQWIQWGGQKINGTKGDSITVDADATETVQYCGGADDCNKRGCSEIFAQREGYNFGNNGIKVSKYLVASGVIGTISASETSRVASGGEVAAGRYDSENCSSCGKDKYKEDGCKCSSEYSKDA